MGLCLDFSCEFGGLSLLDLKSIVAEISRGIANATYSSVGFVGHELAGHMYAARQDNLR